MAEQGTRRHTEMGVGHVTHVGHAEALAIQRRHGACGDRLGARVGRESGWRRDAPPPPRPRRSPTRRRLAPVAAAGVHGRRRRRGPHRGQRRWRRAARGDHPHPPRRGRQPAARHHHIAPPRALPIAKGDRPCSPAPRRSWSLLRGLTAAGIATVAANQTRCNGHFGGLTTAQLFKPQFQDIEKVAVFARIFDHLIMSRTGTPPAPLFIGNGLSDPTGDGVMVAKDVQELAYTYCQRGVPVELHIYSGLDHQQTGPPFLDQAQAFLDQRFAHRPIQNGCGEIGPSDSIAPVPAPAP